MFSGLWARHNGWTTRVTYPYWKLLTERVVQPLCLVLSCHKTNEKLCFFGDWQTDLETNIVYSNLNLFACSLGDSLIVVASYYESKVRLFNIYRRVSH